MFLYLVQHGEAKKEEEDPEQRLTEKGKEDVARVARFTGKLNLNVSEIFPQRQGEGPGDNSRSLAEYLKPKKGISLADNLLPMDDPGFMVDADSRNERRYHAGRASALYGETGRPASLRGPRQDAGRFQEGRDCLS